MHVEQLKLLANIMKIANGYFNLWVYRMLMHQPKLKLVRDFHSLFVIVYAVGTEDMDVSEIEIDDLQ
jgi:hypothetical protein